MLSNFLNDFEEKNQLFEVYAPEGVFFRDTFQKLEGFDESLKDPNRKQSIKRFKTKNMVDKNQESPVVALKKSPSSALKNSFVARGDRSLDRIDPTEKMLFSPKKTMNAVEFYGEGLQDKSFVDKTHSQLNSSQISPVKANTKASSRVKRSTPDLMRQYKSIGRFQEIQKDEAVYKRVLIKNGIYPKDKAIDKSNSAKAIIHHNFDEVVKQCVSRKNNAFKRIDKETQK